MGEFMLENVCRFIPFHKDYNSIHTINFVLETEKQVYTALKIESVYKLHYVRSGSGILHTMGRQQRLKKGDLFFTFPSFPFCIESVEDFSFMYVSFLGARGNQIMEMLGVGQNNFYFPDYEEVGDFWESGLDVKYEVSDLMSECVLLYTFSHMGNRYFGTDPKPEKDNKTPLRIKKYIDDNFSDTEFSLEKIAQNLLYNKKYVSSLFKKEFGVGVSEYVNTVRIQHACTLIEQGFYNISHIAFCCGYNDPQYFSRVFKKMYNVSPTEYIKSARK